jgi:tRNA 2-(methylsulfanyl)-N6-isopentenyladenosine37 hydroxylase
VLSLASRTGRAWVERALANLDEVLVDHAHCEKKAASTAVSLLFKYPEHASLLVPLTRLAREELGHFEEVLGHLEARGSRLRRLVPSPYAARLMTAVRKREPDRLVDTLLCLSLIEARSCERMTLLADALADRELASLYRGLLASEARHHRTYVELATELVPEREARARLAALAAHEAAVLAATPAIARFHA